MKKNKFKLILMIVIGSMLLTGCTTYLKDKKGKNVTNPLTGQNIVENIVCQPESKDSIEIYKKNYEENKDVKDANPIDIETLPKCNKFSVTSGGYKGIWDNIFIRPLAWLILQIGNFVRNYGLALIITSLLIRLVAFPITRKTALQSELIKKARPDLDRIEGKYKDKSDNAAMMKKSQEMAAVYKKYNINPISGCLFAFLQLPLFIAFFEAINRVPAIFEETFLGLQLGTTPINAIWNLKSYFFIYIILIILVGLTTYFSTKLNSAMGADTGQFKMMNIVMLVMITAMTVFTSSGLGLYWLTTNLFTICQNLIVKRHKKA